MRRKGFTLVELLVVIAIIALLMGILMPALSRVRQLAFRLTCGTNLSGLGKAMLIYANDYEDELPRAGGRDSDLGAVRDWMATDRYGAFNVDPTTNSGGTATISSCFDLLVNPLGVQEDFIETSTGGGNWDAIWESAGRVTDWGYAVELSVPFKQLRFQRSDGPQIWSFDAVRSYPREHRHHIGAFPRDRGNNCYLCQAVKIAGFEGATPGRNIEIAPTLTGVRTEIREDFPSGGFEVETEDTEFGLTAKWGVTPNLTFSGAYNPDFSQIEADALQLDINQPFALYFSERRPFFLEGIDFFSSLKTAFHSRTVRDPLWGIKHLRQRLCYRRQRVSNLRPRLRHCQVQPQRHSSLGTSL